MPSAQYQTDAATSCRMRRVRSKDTEPELTVRRLLIGLGYRYCLHRSDLPGCPDIVLPGQRTAIFIHGCFWHRHKHCKRCSMPRRNMGLWKEKFKRTQSRDRKNAHQLRGMGWTVVVIWECWVADQEKLAKCIVRSLRPVHSHRRQEQGFCAK
ncbi:MAG: very short patch repair endonuclease [Planctomycetota bacterium]|nr:very short patch repair endonuclease [Planctomycetota bacterium]